MKLLLRGVRGATTVEANDQKQIMERTAELLTAIVTENAIDTGDIAAIIFSSTPDLNAAFPAKAARQMGWADVPLFGTEEIENPNGVPKCLRILILWNTDKRQKEIKHVYLRDTAVLRQDIAES